MKKRTKTEILPLVDRIVEVSDIDEAAELMLSDGLVMIGIAKGGNGQYKFCLAHCSLKRAEPYFRKKLLRPSPAQAHGTDARDSTGTSGPDPRPARRQC